MWLFSLYIRKCNYEFSVFTGGFAIQGGGEVQVLFREVLRNIFIMKRADPPIDLLHLIRLDIHEGDLMAGRKEGSKGEANVAGTKDRDMKGGHTEPPCRTLSFT